MTSKRSACLAPSAGGFGTVRALAHIRPVCVTLAMLPLGKPGVRIANAWDTFDGEGRLVDQGARDTLRALLQKTPRLDPWPRPSLTDGDLTRARPPKHLRQALRRRLGGRGGLLGCGRGLRGRLRRQGQRCEVGRLLLDGLGGRPELSSATAGSVAAASFAAWRASFTVVVATSQACFWSGFSFFAAA